MKCYNPKKRKVNMGQIRLPDDCTMTTERLTEGARLRFMNSLIPILDPEEYPIPGWSSRSMISSMLSPFPVLLKR